MPREDAGGQVSEAIRRHYGARCSERRAKSRWCRSLEIELTARSLGLTPRDAYPGIESRPGVCGGEACIVRTRIPVWVLDRARRLGATESELLGVYPTLRAEDLANAWSYARAHREEIAHQIEENEAD